MANEASNTSTRNVSISKQFAEYTIAKQRETLIALKAIYDANVARLANPFDASVEAPAKRARKVKANGDAKPAGEVRGRKPSGNSLSDKIEKALVGAPAEGLNIETISKNVMASGFETKSDEKGLENQIRGQVSKLKKAGKVTATAKGMYALVPDAPKTSDEPKPAEAAA